jgi:hypothetical protein
MIFFGIAAVTPFIAIAEIVAWQLYPRGITIDSGVLVILFLADILFWFLTIIFAEYYLKKRGY